MHTIELSTDEIVLLKRLCTETPIGGDLGTVELVSKALRAILEKFDLAINEPSLV